jgi:hypothetical protein
VYPAACDNFFLSREFPFSAALHLFIFFHSSAAAPTTRENCVPPVLLLKQKFGAIFFSSASFCDTEIMEVKLSGVLKEGTFL